MHHRGDDVRTLKRTASQAGPCPGEGLTDPGYSQHGERAPTFTQELDGLDATDEKRIGKLGELSPGICVEARGSRQHDERRLNALQGCGEHGGHLSGALVQEEVLFVANDGAGQ
jgi:hypothetical protein